MQKHKPSASQFIGHLLILALLPVVGLAQGEHNPTGVSGTFNGNVVSAGNYDPYTGNMVRAIDDIVVPGGVGYPLKWTRYWNSRQGEAWAYYAQPNWTFSYISYGNDTNRGFVYFPDGRSINCNNPAPGVIERVGNGALRLADGGKVVFATALRTEITDPYGQMTTVVSNGQSGASKEITITEPGQRYLKVYYNSFGNVATVKAFDGINGTPIQTVTYSYSDFTLVGGATVKVLTGVDYGDGSSASYTYLDLKRPAPPSQPPSPDIHQAGLLTATDVRAGPMREIKYEYWDQKTKIKSERNLVTNEAVSSITKAPAGNGAATHTETRGDGPTRTFNYAGGPIIDGEPLPDPDRGKLVSYTDFLAKTTTIVYGDETPGDAYGYVRSVTDANNRTTSYMYATGSLGQGWGITQITYPDLSFIEQTYTDLNWPYFLDSRTAQRGPGDAPYITDYDRNPSTHPTNPNAITRIDYPASSQNNNVRPSEEFFYNNFGQIIAQRMTNNAYQYFKYDTRGLLTHKSNPTWVYYPTYITNYPNNYPFNEPNTLYEYYTSGPWTDRVLKETRPANVSNQVAFQIFEYDRNLSNGQACAGRGLVTKVTYADNKFITKTYNKWGDLLTSTDELNHTQTTNTYDAYGRLLTTTNPLNRTITNGYIPWGKTSSWITTSNLPFVVTLPSGKKTNTYYDANWRKTRVQVAPSTADEANTYFTIYDDVGNLKQIKDPRNYLTNYTYDVLHRQISVTDPLNRVNSCTYNLRGNKDTETKANTQTISYQYDEMKRVIKVIEQHDSGVFYERNMKYTLGGNLETFWDERNNAYQYLYDASNRRIKTTYPDPSKYEESLYEAAGNLWTYRNRNTYTQTFAYDIRNRPTYFSWNDNLTPSQTTGYDDASRVTTITTTQAAASTTISHKYYDDNLLEWQEEWTSAFNDNFHRKVTYTYDADGNDLTLQYPSGSTFNYLYTNRNQISAVRSGTNSIASYTYDVSGNITARSLDNGTSSAYTVSAVNLASAIQHNLVGGAKRFDYARNNVNDITAVQRDSGLGDGYLYMLNQQIKAYQQNGTVNLGAGTVSNPQTNNTMVFDGCGNRTNLNGVPLAAANNLNQPMDTGITHQANGNMETWNNWKYTYDAQNRLTKAQTPAIGTPTTLAEFYYDGKNRQVARSINGVVRFNVWDDWELIEEYAPGNVLTAKFIQGAHGPIKNLLNNNIYYYQDSLGSVTHIASSTGQLLEYYKYNLHGKPTYWSPGGSELTDGSAHDIRDLFAGERFVTELGLYDNRNRYMSPDLGRFLQPDPIGFKGDASNLYRYCGNDWANNTDPDGRMKLPDALQSVDRIQVFDPGNDGNTNVDVTKREIKDGRLIAAQATQTSATQMSAIEVSRTLASEGQGGVPARLVPHTDNKGNQIIHDYGHKKQYEWRVTDKKGNPFKATDLTHKETKVSQSNPNASVQTSETRRVRVSSQGIVTDTVGFPRPLGPNHPPAHTVNTFRSTVYWDKSPYRLSTRLVHDIGYKDGVYTISAKHIEPPPQK